MLYRAVVAASLVASAFAGSSAPAADASGSTCYEIKSAYQASSCCSSNLQQVTDYTISAPPPPPMTGTNECYNQKLDVVLPNSNCTKDGVVDVLEQSGTNVTKGYVGHFDTDVTPIMTAYWEAGLCPVNVHWHLGTEHYSLGQYDEAGTGPGSSTHRRLRAKRQLGAGGDVRKGFQCHHYDADDAKYTTPYDWKFCTGMVVGETYEVHWPHSAAGACGTPSQYQTPFYDGVFCKWVEKADGTWATHSHIGVQGQVFTIVNDESYYYPDLIRGMIVDGAYGEDIAYYTGSTTGTSRNNEICSKYAPITWQVDRKCHLISASSFDKMCEDMLAQRDDMTDDLYAHGSRELVLHKYAADNHVRRE